MMPVSDETNAKLPGRECLTRAEYRRVFDEGKSFPSRYFVMWLIPAASNKMGVVVSKRTFHLSVQRNRAKRLMRESYRLSKHLLMPGYWIILLGRRKLVLDETKSDDVRKDLLRIFRKAKILRGESQ